MTSTREETVSRSSLARRPAKRVEVVQLVDRAGRRVDIQPTSYLRALHVALLQLHRVTSLLFVEGLENERQSACQRVYRLEAVRRVTQVYVEVGAGWTRSYSCQPSEDDLRSTWS